MGSPPHTRDTSHGMEVLLRPGVRSGVLAGVVLLAALVLLTFSSAPAAADTPVSGSITSDTTWTQAMSPIWVEDSVTVTNGATLTIDPGVEVRFNGTFSLIVSDGALVANGDPAGAGVIEFTSNESVPGAGDWNGIIFNDDLGTSLLDDVVIEYAFTAVTLNGVSVPLSNVEITDASFAGVVLGGGAVPDYDVSITGCTMADLGSYGVSVPSLTNVDLDLTVSGCTFSDYGSAAIQLSTFSSANYSVSIVGNSFNTSLRAVTFTGSATGTGDEGDSYAFAFNGNFLNSSLDSYGVYNPWDITGFQDATLTFDGNTFLAPSGGRSYGVYLDDFFGFPDYPQNLTLQFTNNEVTNLEFTGLYIDSVADYRAVALDFSGNTFQNTDAVLLDYGVYAFLAPYYSSDDDPSSLAVDVNGNTVLDLGGTGVNFVAGATDGFRTVALNVNGNVMRNTGTGAVLDYGVWFPGFAFADPAVPTSFTATVSGNTMEDLDDYGVYFSSTISGFRDVLITMDGNAFGNSDDPWMDSGVHFSSSPSYTPDHPGSLTFAATNGDYINLTSYAVYLPTVSTYQQVVVDVDGNTFDGSSYGLYMPGGVDNAESLTFNFSNNTAYEVANYGLYATSFVGISASASQADFALVGNTISESPNGLYLGTITDYDLSNSLRVQDNVLVEIVNTAIFLGMHDATDSWVTVAGNDVTGPTGVGLLVAGFMDQSAQVEIVGNTFEGVDVSIEVDYAAYGSGDTALSIRSNNLRNVEEYGIFLYEVYNAAAFIDITDNTIEASPGSFFSATLVHFDAGGSGWYRSLVDVSITDTVLESGLHAIYFYGTDGSGATVLLDIAGVTVIDSAFGITLDFPVDHPADIMNVKIQDSTFQGNHRGFLYLNQPGFGLLPIDIVGVQVTGFGDWGGYAFFMGANLGANVRVDVWSSSFQGATGNLGDVYAGFGAVEMNFYFIDSITDGVANDFDQRIRVLWKVDVEVYKGENLDVPAAGVLVYAMDQFGTSDFVSVTDVNGTVTGQWISGTVIAYYAGNSYAGPAVQMLRAEWGPFNGTTAATFASNGTAVIYLPGDLDADGLNDIVDPDDDNDGIPDVVDANPNSAGFLDFLVLPYSLHLWLLVGFVGAVAIPLGWFIFWKTPKRPKTPKPPRGETPPPPPEEY